MMNVRFTPPEIMDTLLSPVLCGGVLHVLAGRVLVDGTRDVTSDPDADADGAFPAFGVKRCCTL